MLFIGLLCSLFVVCTFISRTDDDQILTQFDQPSSKEINDDILFN